MEDCADSAVKSWTDIDMDHNVSCTKFRCSSCYEAFCESPDMEKHMECHIQLKMLDTNTILSENEIVGQDVSESNPKDLFSPSSETCPTQEMLDDHMGSHIQQINQDSGIIMNGNGTTSKDVIDTSPGRLFSPCPDTCPTLPDPDNHMECHDQQLDHDTGTTTTNGNKTTSEDVVESNPKHPCSPCSETCPSQPDLGAIIESHTQQLNVSDKTTTNENKSTCKESNPKLPCSPYSETCPSQPDLDEVIESHTRQLNNKDADTTVNENENIGEDIIEISVKHPSSQCMETCPIKPDLEVHMKCPTLQLNYDNNRETIGASESSTKYRCSSCGRMFFSQVDLDKHEEGHSQQDNYVRICKVVLTDLWITHPLIMAQLKDTDTKKEIVKMQVNEKSPNYSCTSCFVTFLRRVDLEQHLESSWHTQQLNHMQSAYVKTDRIQIYGCDFCSRGSTDQNIMEEHRRTYFRINNRIRDNNNEGDKPLKCKLCERGFMVASTLEAHSILHKPFPHVCECGVGFYQKCDLDAHRLLVTHNKPQVKKEANMTKSNFIRTEPKYKTSDSESDEPRTSRTIGPRLKASLTFKRSKHRSNKSPNKRRRVGSYKRLNIAKEAVELNDENSVPKTDNTEKYECTSCEKTFSKIVSYKNHMIRIHGLSYDKDKQCNICGKKFDNVTKRKDHLASHFGVKNYKCDICKKTYSQSGALKLHRLRHTGERNFPCKVCGKSFYDAANLRLHDRVHTGVKPFECKQCLKSFADPSAYKRHLMIHTGLKPYKCKICDKAFCDPAALFRHNRAHQGYNVPCTLCDRKFASKPSFRRHIKFYHGTPTPADFFECAHCCKKFTSKGNLANHMRVHSKTLNSLKSCKCEVCGKILLQNNLKNHIKRSHLKLLNYECGKCGLRFVHKHELRNHTDRMHNRKRVRDRSFQCDYCHRWYFDKNAVEKHIVAKHLGIKCELCSRAFSTSMLLKAHRSKGCIRCEVCHAAFPCRSMLNYHFTLNHLKESEREFYECDYCSKRYLLRGLLKKHIYTSHLKHRLFECDDCGESFSSRAGIVNHLRQNHMVVLYCHICFKRFFRDSDFVRHKRAKCRPPPNVPCEICNKTFPTVARLSHHLRDTHGPERYQCDICGDKFKHRSSLPRHFRLVHKY